MDKPEMIRHIEWELREHEILLSFTHDSEAEMFANWWNEEGFDTFQAYTKRPIPSSGEICYNDETVVDPDPITEG